MPSLIKKLQVKRDELLHQLSTIGEFRRGTISVNYRKCGKTQCHCAQEGAQGHGPQYLWSATIERKSVAKNLRLGPELEKYIEDTERYKKFSSICEELVRINEQLCDALPIRQPENEKELERLKKKLQKKLLKKHEPK